MQASPDDTTLLFTDIEGSTRLWEEQGERMARALAEHDALSRAAVERNNGIVVKMTGDGMYAAFADTVGRGQRGADAAAVARRSRDDQRDIVPRSLRSASRHRRAPERRSVRQPGQSRGADHEGRARQPGPAVPGGRRSRSRKAAAVGVACAISAACGCATSPRPSTCTSSFIRASARIFPRCARSPRRPTTCRSRLPRSSAANASSPKSRACSKARACSRLLGMGGLGKTRLSLQIAADVIGELSGRRLVRRSRADQAIRRWLPSAVAQVLNVREEPGKSLGQTLCEHVKDRELLLVLDNCEHLIARVREPGRRVARRRAQGPHPRHQPRGAAHPRRADLPRPSAGGARSQCGRRGPASLGSGAAFRRTRTAAEARLPADRARRAGDRRDLRATRRHSACAGTGGGPHAIVVDRRDQRAAARSLQAAHRRKPRRAGAPADAARAGKLVVRSAAGTGADAARPAERVRRRLRSFRRPKRSAARTRSSPTMSSTS